ncbi:Putative regulatory protein [Fulvivirga imtechensis AK7]|uniref:Putative regulatory protein n=2 Tax=Fulvivirga TaxID=396811 RepID=L8JW86_9BACT|nr:Putative regulatory protein [Fulvivirga imtechensis AK7]
MTLGYDREEITNISFQELGDLIVVEAEELVFLSLSHTNQPPLEVFSYIQELFSEKPIIVLSDKEDPGISKQLISVGAQDYLVKETYDQFLLKKAIRYAIERRSLLKQVAHAKNDYEKLFLHHPNPMLVFDRDTLCFLRVNHAATEQYGYSESEFLKLTLKDIRIRGDHSKLNRLYKSLINSERLHDVGIWTHRKKTGEEFYAHIYWLPTKFEGRKAQLLVAIDETETIVNAARNEELTKEIKAYADRINSILESITDGFFAVDNEWKFTYVNRVFEKTFARKRENLIGKNVWEVFPAKFGEKIAPRYERAMRTRKHFNFEEYFDALDMWFSVSVYPSEGGLAVYIQDVTKSRKLKEKIFNDQINLNALINNTDDLIWSIDKDLNLLSANEAYKKRMRSFSQTEIKEGRPVILKDADKELQEKWTSLYKKALTGQSYNMESAANTTDGSIFYTEVSFNPIRNPQQEVIGVGCYARDITERKKHQLMIEHHNRLLEDIAWKQSHKMRGPVASILGIMQIFDFDDMDNPFNHELLQHLKNTTEKLDAMIKDIVSSTAALDHDIFNENGSANTL